MKNASEFTNYGLTTSYANASAEAEKFGFGASVNILNFQTTANTDVASGVRINQDADNKTLAMSVLLPIALLRECILREISTCPP